LKLILKKKSFFWTLEGKSFTARKKEAINLVETKNFLLKLFSNFIYSIKQEFDTWGLILSTTNFVYVITGLNCVGKRFYKLQGSPQTYKFFRSIKNYFAYVKRLII
jgi:hypothetical protein